MNCEVSVVDSDINVNVMDVNAELCEVNSPNSDNILDCINGDFCGDKVDQEVNRYINYTSTTTSK